MTLNKPAAPVHVANVEPIPVVVAPDEDAAPAAARASAKVDADALRSEGQRSINRIWERTQQVIALSVVEVALMTAGIVVAVRIARGDGAASDPAFLFLASVANLVIGFYFGRTNHTRTGGIGEGAGER